MEHAKRVSTRNGALSHERFLRREQNCVELALRWGEPSCLLVNMWL